VTVLSGFNLAPQLGGLQATPLEVFVEGLTCKAVLGWRPDYLALPRGDQRLTDAGGDAECMERLL
jgi:hypothetical protein